MDKDLNNEFYLELKMLLEKYQGIYPAVIAIHTGLVGANVMIDGNGFEGMPQVEHFAIGQGAKNESMLVMGCKNWFKARGFNEEGVLSKALNLVQSRFYRLKDRYYDNS